MKKCLLILFIVLFALEGFAAPKKRRIGESGDTLYVEQLKFNNIERRPFFDRLRLDNYIGSIALGDTAVGNAEIKAAAVDSGKLANNSVPGSKIPGNSIPAGKLKANAVQDSNVYAISTAGKIQGNAVAAFPRTLDYLSVSRFLAGILSVVYLDNETEFNQLFTLVGGLSGVRGVFDEIFVSFIKAGFLQADRILAGWINGVTVVTDFSNETLYKTMARQSNKQIFIPSGTYLINRPIEIYGDTVSIRGAGSSTILKLNTFLDDATGYYIKKVWNGAAYVDSLEITTTSATSYKVTVLSTKLADFTNNIGKYVMLNPRSVAHNAASFNAWKGIICRITSTNAPDSSVTMSVYKFAPYWSGSGVWLGRSASGDNSFISDTVPIFIVGSASNECDWFEMSDLTLDGDWPNKALPDTSYDRDDFWDYSLWGLLSLDAKNGTIDKIRVQNVGGMDGINIESSGIKVTNSYFANVSSACIHFGARTTDATFTGNTFYRGRAAGIYICYGDKRSIVSNNHFRACGVGYEGLGGPSGNFDAQILCNGNVFAECLYASIANYFGGFATEVIISNNICLNSPGAHANTGAIDVRADTTLTTRGERISIIGNLVVQDASRAYVQYGINVKNFRLGNISGNTVKNYNYTNSTGIRFEDCAKLLITANNVDSCYFGIDEENAANPQNSGDCEVYGNATSGCTTDIDMDDTLYGASHYFKSDSTYKYLVNGVWTTLTID
ncbi:MAG TPA: right-handed parallel beta-helix repeat-containing protein [bacterium]|nr:right-handed parallel beta-helix repeat-containing protein [bacterium]